MSFISPLCIAPRCGDNATVGRFCAPHSQAPVTRRAGWVSAHKRKEKIVKLDAHCVATNLWVGSRPPFDIDLPEVDVLVLCAEEIQPERYSFHGKVVRCPISDGNPTDIELTRVLKASKVVAQSLVDKKRVLVTCAAGINRSAFVAAMALGRVTRMSAAEIIQRIKDRRHKDCLYNLMFVKHLHRMIGDGRKAGAVAMNRPSSA